MNTIVVYISVCRKRDGIIVSTHCMLHLQRRVDGDFIHVLNDVKQLGGFTGRNLALAPTETGRHEVLESSADLYSTPKLCENKDTESLYDHTI